jgi:hypothetical protein
MCYKFDSYVMLNCLDLLALTINEGPRLAYVTIILSQEKDLVPAEWEDKRSPESMWMQRCG